MKRCTHKLKACPNNCSELIYPVELEKHLKDICTHRSTTCPYCHITDIHQIITGSHYSECTEVPIACPVQVLVSATVCLPNNKHFPVYTLTLLYYIQFLFLIQVNKMGVINNIHDYTLNIASCHSNSVYITVQNTTQ